MLFSCNHILGKYCIFCNEPELKPLTRICSKSVGVLYVYVSEWVVLCVLLDTICHWERHEKRVETERPEYDSEL